MYHMGMLFGVKRSGNDERLFVRETPNRGGSCLRKGKLFAKVERPHKEPETMKEKV
jgi:hypothetical protein